MRILLAGEFPPRRLVRIAALFCSLALGPQLPEVDRPPGGGLLLEASTANGDARRVVARALERGTLIAWCGDGARPFGLRATHERRATCTQADAADPIANALRVEVEAGDLVELEWEDRGALAPLSLRFSQAVPPELSAEARDVRALLDEAAGRMAAGRNQAACEAAVLAAERSIALQGCGSWLDQYLDLARANELAFDLQLEHLACSTLEFLTAETARWYPRRHRSSFSLETRRARCEELRGDLRGSCARTEALLSAWADVLPRADGDRLRILASHANRLKELGELARAEEVLTEVIALRAAARAHEPFELGAARSNLAGILTRRGDYERALDLHRSAIADIEGVHGEGHLWSIRARTMYGSTLEAARRYHEAREVFEGLVAICERSLPPGHPDLLWARANFAVVARVLGDYDRALELERAVVAARSAVLPSGHTDLLMARMNLAGTLGALGRLSEARAIEIEVVEAARTTLPGGHRLRLIAQRNHATTLGSLGDRDAARALLEETLRDAEAVYPDDDPDVQGIRILLASVVDDPAHGLELCRRALENLEARLAPDHPSVSHARSMFARRLSDAGWHSEAVDLAQAALESNERRLSRDHPEVVAALATLAQVLAAAGDLEGARERLTRAIAVATTPADHPQLAAMLLALGEVEERLGDAAGALAAAERAASSLADHGLASAWTASPREIEARTSGLRQLIGQCLALLALRPEATLAQRELAVELAETWRGLGVASAIVARASGGELAAARAELRRRSFEVASAVERAVPRAELLRSIDARDAAARRLGTAGGSGELRERTGRAPLPDRWVDPWAGWDAVLAYSIVGTARGEGDVLLACVLRPGAAPAWRDLGPAPEIEQAVDGWHAALSPRAGRGVSRRSGAATSEVEQAGAMLRSRVLDPLREPLGDARRVLVLPDGALHRVAFDALPDQGSFVGDRLTIGIRASLWELALARPPSERGGDLLAFGDPAFATTDDPARPERLPASGREVREIAELFERTGRGHARTRLESDATVARLLEEAPSARWLHVATHGWSSPDLGPRSRARASPDPAIGVETSRLLAQMSPLVLCGLELAAGADGGRGRITAEELASLDLSGCELAVLSACGTNRGVERAGQGVASLSKSLVIAGARAVVTSLWSVPDEATRALMVAFYRQLWEHGRGPAEALWHAKTELRAAGHPPVDWAGWVCCGG